MAPAWPGSLSLSLSQGHDRAASHTMDWLLAWFLLPHLMGTGIFLTMYSHTTSMLYFSWAEMGMMGTPSAMVPWMN